MRKIVEIIYPNGETLDFEFKGKKPSLEELQGAVDGLIEVAYLTDGKLMIINEEGKINNLEPNHVATDLAFPNGGDVIAGNAVVMPREMME